MAVKDGRAPFWTILGGPDDTGGVEESECRPEATRLRALLHSLLNLLDMPMTKLCQDEGGSPCQPVRSMCNNICFGETMIRRTDKRSNMFSKTDSVGKKWPTDSRLL